jgi:hypothetical protein
MAIRVLQLTIAGLGPSAHARDRLDEWGASLSRLGYFGGSQAEGAVGFREPVPTAAVAGAAAQTPAAASTQCGPAVLDLRQSMVHWLAQFASYCEAGDGPEVASTGLACLLVLAFKSAAPEKWETANSPGTSSAHRPDDR